MIFDLDFGFKQAAQILHGDTTYKLNDVIIWAMSCEEPFFFRLDVVLSQLMS